MTAGACAASTQGGQSTATSTSTGLPHASVLPAAPTIPPRTAEDRLFDAHQESPVQLLRDMYERHRILVLGYPSHDYTTQYQLVDSLLRMIGPDPRLKFIVLERAAEDAPVLEAASTAALPVPELVRRFSSPARAHLSLCFDGEFAYTWARFLPRIRALNAARPAAHPIHVTSVDGVALSRAVGVTDIFTLLSIIEGEYRETATSANVWHTLWPTLGPTDKVIMLYQIQHVIKTFTVQNQSSGRVPSNWMGTLLRDHPEAESQIGIVLLDEPVRSSDGQSHVTLRFTGRQAARWPDHTFGVRLAPFREVLTDSGTSVYASRQMVPFGNGLASSAPLPAMVDGVLWMPHIQRWAIKEAASYLPEFCGSPQGPSPAGQTK